MYSKGERGKSVGKRLTLSLSAARGKRVEKRLGMGHFDV
jgi:hypothetical protein